MFSARGLTVLPANYSAFSSRRLSKTYEMSAFLSLLAGNIINLLFQAREGIADFNVLFLAAEAWIVPCMLIVHVPRGCYFLGGYGD